jgi:uncharacterized protein (TIGR03437 family)
MHFRSNSSYTKRLQFLRHLFLAVFLLCLCAGGLLAQRARLTQAIDNSRRVRLAGHMHPLARTEFDRGPVQPSMQLQSLNMILKPSAEQQAELNQLLAAQQDPSSPDYHRWLTPEEYADRFGASPEDVGKITQWLQAQGFHVTGVARARNWISFSGTAAHVASAFGVEIHKYQVNNETHFANITDPSVPEAFSVMVQGLRGLSDFRMRPLLKPRAASILAAPRPAYTSSTGEHYLSPDDFATIYDLKPLYGAGINGTGQKLVVTGQTQINLSDIEQFRSQFNLVANDPQVMLVPNTTDPGISSTDLPEADLDVELAGAAAPNASITFLYSSDVMNAAQYAIDQDLAPVLSISYGSCETETTSSDALIFRSWAQQGNSEGITWVAASGDSGGADCIAPGDNTDAGPSVDVPASIPEVTGMGGTEFNEGYAQYWSTTNNASSGSALNYIPEMVWNDSSPGNPAAGGGGASVFFTKPSWQSGAGVPSDNARNVPDVSLAASPDHDGYLVYTGGQRQIYGGTSVASPSFAGIAVLLNQYLVMNGVQASPGVGNMNPKLYALAQTSPAAFHDITSGNNIVTVACGLRAQNCVSGSYGFNAGPGYDQASGLGSVDVQALFTAWSGKSGSSPRSMPSMTLFSGASAISSSASTTVTATVTGSNGGTPSGTVTLYFGSVLVGSATLSGLGSSASASITVSGANLPVGSDTITAQYSGNSLYAPATASVVINVSSSTSTSLVISGITNGASFRQSYAPGMILTVFGSGLAPSTWSASTLPLPAQLAGVSATINGIDAPLYYVSPTQLNMQIPYEVPVNALITLKVTNNGQTGTTTFTSQPAAPGIFTNTTGALVPAASASTGQTISLYLTGQGAVSPSIATGAAPSLGTSIANLPGPQQPVTVLVGGLPAHIQFAGIPPDLVGVTQINFVVPAGLAPGTQPVAVSIGGVLSPAANLTIQ